MESLPAGSPGSPRSSAAPALRHGSDCKYDPCRAGPRGRFPLGWVRTWPAGPAAPDSLADQTGSVNRPRSRIFGATSLWLSVYNAALLASPIMIVDQGHQEYRLPRGSTSG